MASYYSIAAFKREYTKIGTAFKQLAMTFNMDTNEGERSMLRHFFFLLWKKRGCFHILTSVAVSRQYEVPRCILSKVDAWRKHRDMFIMVLCVCDG